jgi:alpha-L-fucosidase
MNTFKQYMAPLALALGLLAPLGLQAEPADPTPTTPATNDARFQWWRDARFGMFVHWGPVSIKGTEIGWSRGGERRDRGDSGTEVPAAEYDNLYHQFSATNFNATEWVAVAKAAGMKYLVFTAKHHDGFCEFDSKLTDYKVTRSPLGRDVCAELADACHKAGIHLGFYFSPPDWHHPDFFTAHHDRYIQYLHGQVREVLSNYGAVDILWFDATGGTNTIATWDAEKLIQMVRQLQPQVLLTKRCAGIGDYDTPEQRIGAYQSEPWETCMTICQQWSWKPDDTMKSLQECLQTLVLCAGGDGNLLFNVGPRPDGTIEPRQVERLKEMGAWLQNNGESIYGTRGGPWKPTKAAASTRKGNTVYLHLLRPETHWKFAALPHAIRSATRLDGSPVAFSQKDGNLTIDLKPADLQPNDTIIKLELDGSAMDIQILAPRASVKATASNVFQKMNDNYGPQQAFDGDAESRWATDGGTKQAWIAADLGKPRSIGRVRVNEALEQRVQRFEFQYRASGEWKTLFSGTTLGHTFDKAFPPVVAQEFRLNILDATEGPTINEINLLSE